MKFHEAVGLKLSSLAGLTALVGDRIFLAVAFQEAATPLVVWTFSIRADQGLSDYATRADLRIACFADNADDALAVAYEVRGALNTNVPTLWGSLSIQHCLFLGTEVESVDAGDGTFVVMATADFNVLYGPET
jgi:hypothetical protein